MEKMFISKSVSLAKEMARACLRTMSAAELKEGLWMQMNMESGDQIPLRGGSIYRMINLLILVYPGYRVQVNGNIYKEKQEGEWTSGYMEIRFPDCNLAAVYDKVWRFDCRLRNGAIVVEPR